MPKALDDYHFLRLGEATLNDPYPFFQKLRAECPVYREPDFGVYLVGRYDDIVACSRDTETFSTIANTTGPFAPLPAPIDELDEYRLTDREADNLFRNDPPGHTKYRALVNTLFVPKRVAALEERIREHVRDLFTGFTAKGRGEFVNAIAYVLPLVVVGELLGVTAEDNDGFKLLFQEEFAAMDETFIGHPEAPRVVAPSNRMLLDYFRREIASRKVEPRDDVMSTLTAARLPDGSPVADYELVKLCKFLYSAGGDANTPQLLTTGAKVLAENPDIADRLRAEPALIDAFIEENLRYETPAMGLFRLAKRDTEVGSVPIRKGEFVMLLYASGNRDETYFEEPEEFKLNRPKRRVLSFGSGPHTCPGAPLARLEARIVFEEMLQNLSNIRIAESERSFKYLPSVILRSVRRLQLEFDRR